MDCFMSFRDGFTKVRFFVALILFVVIMAKCVESSAIMAKSENSISDLGVLFYDLPLRLLPVVTYFTIEGLPFYDFTIRH